MKGISRCLGAYSVGVGDLAGLGADGTTWPKLAAYLRQSPLGVAPLIKGGLSQAAADVARRENRPRQPEARLILVIDQFEKFFLPTHGQPRKSKALFRFINTSQKRPSLGDRSMKSEMLDRLHEFPELAALMEGPGNSIASLQRGRLKREHPWP